MKGRIMAKKKKQASEQPHESFAQDLIPLRTIEGSFIRRNDGASIVLVHLEGTNDSLFTYEQKLDESFANRSALVALKQPFSILKLPKTIDSNIQLVKIDREITKLKHEVRENSFPDTHPKAIRLRLLEEKLRPKAEQEATSSDRVIHPTYVAIEFDGKSSDKQNIRDVKIFVDRFKESGRNAHICGFNEIIEVLQLYFTPRHVNASAVKGNVPVMAKRRG